MSTVFHEEGYLAINTARMDHLASLHLPIAGRGVLELGAGIGDLTGFFLDLGCFVHTSDGRPENVSALHRKYDGQPNVSVHPIDIEKPTGYWGVAVLFAYGLLYHLENPLAALETMAYWCDDLLLLETCVLTHDGIDADGDGEDKNDPRNSLTGDRVLLHREQIHAALSKHFKFVYMPTTQPDHPDFPLDWSVPATDGVLRRAIFVASRSRIDHPLLTTEIPMRQTL